MAVRSSRLLRNISLVFLEPYDVEEIVKGVSKLVPNSATVEMLGEDSGASKHVPCSATEKLDTRYQLPATPALGFAMSGRIPGREMRGRWWRCSRLDLNRDAVAKKYLEMFEEAILKK